MTYMVCSGTIATWTLLCNFICIHLWGESSCTLKCIMSLPWATSLHCGASFCDVSYTLLQSNFVAYTVVCNVLNASSHCDVLSHYGCVVVALLLWHFIEPWGHCHFITGTIYLGAFLMSSCVVGSWDSSTQRPCNDLTHKLFDLFASSTLVTPRVPCFHFGCHCYGWSSCLSMWLDWKDI
jgi:hypothetical protein